MSKIGIQNKDHVVEKHRLKGLECRADLWVLSFTITGGKIVQVDVIADPARLRELDVAVLNG
jgi:hypothetical protein